VLSVNLELSVSAPAHGPKARPERRNPQSDGFSGLVDNNATVPESSQKQVSAADVSSKPASSVPSKLTQDDSGSDTTAKGTLVTPLAETSDTVVAATDAAPLAQIVLKADSGDQSEKKLGTIKVLPEEKKSDGKDGSGEQADDAVVTQPVPAPAPDALAIVTVIANAPEPAATPVTPRVETAPAPAAIAAAAAVTVAAAVAATAPQAPVKPTKAASNETTAALPKTDVALPADTETKTPAEVIAALSPATSTAPAASGKPAAAAATTDAVISSTNDKQITDKSARTITPDQTTKPNVPAQIADTKPPEDKAAATDGSKSDVKPDTGQPAPVEKATPQPERSAQPVAPLLQHALQPDQILQPPSTLPQPPVQHHLANLTAIPVSSTQAALIANTPVPVSGLAVDIALRAAGGSSRFEIRLDPAELGRIDVRLDVDKHGNVTSHLTVERPATLDMLRQDAPRLQQALEDAGLKTGDSGLQFSLRDQSSSGRDNDNGAGRNSQRLVIAEEDAMPAQIAGRTYGRTLASSGGVDIRI